MISTVLLFLIGYLPLSESVTSQLKTSTIVSHLAVLNPFMKQSVHVYKGFGAEHLWERRRVPELNWPPVKEDGMTAGEALTR
jgi:hypothetical protein